ncbi:hypothetical protein F5141DRAFT_1086671 [Pisolithus sp. B1]|nr:hypothetical protein F5141DRAFT_1086671 [Pisolithus sp. B1]
MEDVNEASLMLDIVERGDPTVKQLQTVSRQVADIATTIQQQHANMTFTTEILCLIVEVMQNHAPSVVADVFKAWTRGARYSPPSTHFSPPQTDPSPDFEEFSARIDPLGETHSSPSPCGVGHPFSASHGNDKGVRHPTGSPLPPSDPWSSSSVHDVPAPSPQATTSNPPPHCEDTWQVPSDWDARGGGPRRLRREGAFIHKPDWDAMLKTYGRGAGAVEDDHPDALTTDGGHASTAASSAPCSRIHKHENREHVSPPTQCPASNSQSQTTANNTEDARPHGRRSDSPDATELRRRVDELKAYFDAGYEGRLPPYQNKMKDRRNASRSPNSNVPATSPSPTHATPRKKRQRTPSQSPTRSPSRPSPGPHADVPLLHQDRDDSADLRTAKRMKVSGSPSTPGPAAPPAPRNTPASYRTPEPEVTPKFRLGLLERTLPRRGPLKRTATMEHFD